MGRHIELGEVSLVPLFVQGLGLEKLVVICAGVVETLGGPQLEPMSCTGTYDPVEEYHAALGDASYDGDPKPEGVHSSIVLETRGRELKSLLK